MSLESWEGRCHCGAIGFTYRTALPGGRWSIRACQCSFCRLHDALSTSDPGGGLDFEIGEPELLQLYRFGGRTADFLIQQKLLLVMNFLLPQEEKEQIKQWQLPV